MSVFEHWLDFVALILASFEESNLLTYNNLKTQQAYERQLHPAATPNEQQHEPQAQHLPVETGGNTH